MATTSRTAEVQAAPPWDFSPGQEIYLSDTSYMDAKATVLEIPKYGWKIKAIVNGLAMIEYHRPNLKLLISISCEVK